MSTATSIHIGLNRVDPAYYGSEARLGGCINDANAMFQLAAARGFKNSALLTDEQATSTAIFNFLRRAARDLKAGDTLLTTFAGHGSLVPDRNNDEASGDDQTWCAYDRMIVDDELAKIWSEFQAGVRIILVSDSCHSESVARLLMLASRERFARGASRERSLGGALVGEQDGDNRITGYRVLPPDAARYVESHDRELYESIQRDTVGSEHENIKATVITLSACRDDQTAADGEKNGLYTSNLLAVWNDGRFRGGYRQFQETIAARIAHRQDPQFRVDGTPSAAFVGEQPFTAAGAGDVPSYSGGVNYAAVDDPNTARVEVILPYAMLDDYTDDQIWDAVEQDGLAMLSAMRNVRTSPQVNGHIAARMKYRVGQNGVSSEKTLYF